MEASAIIYDVSRDLNDQVDGATYIRWTQSQLLSYLQEAVVELAHMYKQLFYKTVVVALRPGDVWQEACTCTHILRVVGESTWDGQILRSLQQRSDSNVFVWPGGEGDNCKPSSAGNNLNGFSINSIQDNQFKVFPPVAPGQTKYVVVECYEQPETDRIDASYDVDNRFVQAVKQWMLYRALIVDSENNPAIVQVANIHRETYFTLVKEIQLESAEQEARDNAGTGNIRAVQNGSSRQVSS